MRSFARTGADVQIFASVESHDRDSGLDKFLFWIGMEEGEGEFHINWSASNVGRLDATIIGWAAWIDPGGHLWRRTQASIVARRALGWRSHHMPLILFNQSISVVGTSEDKPSTVSSDEAEMSVPFVIKAGQFIAFPSIGVGAAANPRQLRTALRLATGEIVKARPVLKNALDPFFVGSS